MNLKTINASEHQKRPNLDIMSGSEVQHRPNIEGGSDESVLLLHIVVHGEVFGGDGHLRVGDLALAVILEGELELGEAVEELAGDLVEEDGAVAVVFGGDPDRGTLREREEEPGLNVGGALSRGRWRVSGGRGWH